MSEGKFVVTYDALAADIVDTGADRSASLVVLAADRQRIVIRMDRRAAVRLRKRIDLVLQRQRPAARRPARPTT